MPDYSNAKIYKLVSDKTDMIYIGSTTKKLYRRLSNHKKGGCNSKILFKLGGNISIELIKLFPCDGKKELEKEEGEYIKKYKNICVNKCIPGRTRKEYKQDNKENIKKYYENNKEKILEQSKKYRENNKEKRKEYDKEYNKEKRKEKYKCECGSEICIKHKARHNRSIKHISFINNNK